MCVCNQQKIWGPFQLFPKVRGFAFHCSAAKLHKLLLELLAILREIWSPKSLKLWIEVNRALFLPSMSHWMTMFLFLYLSLRRRSSTATHCGGSCTTLCTHTFFHSDFYLCQLVPMWHHQGLLIPLVRPLARAGHARSQKHQSPLKYAPLGGIWEKKRGIKTQ